MPSTSEIFQELQNRLQNNPDKVAGLNGVFQFSLAGEDGGDYYISVSNGSAQVVQGVHNAPGVTISMTANNFKEMVAGRLNPTAAFFSGQLQIKGDMGMALRLQSLIG